MAEDAAAHDAAEVIDEKLPKGALSPLLMPHIPTPGSIRYGVDMRESSIESKVLIDKKQMIQDIRRKAKQVSKKYLKGELEHVYVAKKFSLDPAQKKDWLETVAKRIRTMLCHVSMVESRKPATKWLQTVLGAQLG